MLALAWAMLGKGTLTHWAWQLTSPAAHLLKHCVSSGDTPLVDWAAAELELEDWAAARPARAKRANRYCMMLD